MLESAVLSPEVTSSTAAELSCYLQDLVSLFHQVDVSQVARIVESLFEAWSSGRNVLLAGNGGSSSSVSHIVADLQKNVFMETGVPLKTLCLTDSTPLLTAWANDTDWENVFAAQVQCWGQPGDLLIAVSGSGNSGNIIKAVVTAKELGMHTIGLAGFEGGRLANVADECLIVRSDSMQRIEDVHMSLLHAAFCSLLTRCSASAADGRAK